MCGRIEMTVFRVAINELGSSNVGLAKISHCWLILARIAKSAYSKAKKPISYLTRYSIHVFKQVVYPGSKPGTVVVLQQKSKKQFLLEESTQIQLQSQHTPLQVNSMLDNNNIDVNNCPSIANVKAGDLPKTPTQAEFVRCYKLDKTANKLCGNENSYSDKKNSIQVPHFVELLKTELASETLFSQLQQLSPNELLRLIQSQQSDKGEMA